MILVFLIILAQAFNVGDAMTAIAIALIGASGGYWAFRRGMMGDKAGAVIQHESNVDAHTIALIQEAQASTALLLANYRDQLAAANARIDFLEAELARIRKDD